VGLALPKGGRLSLALIDGDEAVFKACTAKVEDIDWDSGATVTRLPTFEEAAANLRKLFTSWTGDAGCAAYRVILSPDDRKLFRRGIDPTYKEGRSEKPENFWPLVAYIRSEHDHEAIPGLEADDVMGIMTGPKAVIVSSDKDMKTVPGRLLNPGRGTFTVIGRHEADRWWMYQTLAGDPTDGYSGAWKIGPKKAEAVLDQGYSLKEWWPLVVDAFLKPKNKKGEGVQTVQEARTNAMLARILRPGDYTAGHISYQLGAHPVELDVARISR